MTEPVVTLTDYALTIECGILAALCWTHGPGPYRPWLTLFFAAAALAPLLGGTVHGFFHEESTARRILWTGTLLSIGMTALAGWVIGARLVLPGPIGAWVIGLALVQLGVYAAVVLFVSQGFWVAIVDYLPAALFLLGAFVVAWRQTGAMPLAVGAAGLVLALLGAVGQQARFGIHPVWFDHNAVYHAVQAVSFLLFYQAARWLLVAPPTGVTG